MHKDLKKEIDRFLDKTGAPYVWVNDEEQREWLEIVAKDFYQSALNDVKKEVERLIDEYGSAPTPTSIHECHKDARLIGYRDVLNWIKNSRVV